MRPRSLLLCASSCLVPVLVASAGFSSQPGSSRSAPPPGAVTSRIFARPAQCDLWGVLEPAYAPESPRLAAVHWWIHPEYGNLLEMSLDVVDSTGSGVGASLFGYGQGRPAWSPDGSSLAFCEYSALRVWRIGDRDPRLVIQEESIAHPAWSPDGVLIAYTRDGDIWAVPAEGGEPQVLVSSPGVDEQPAWSPEGARLAVASNRDGSQGFDIWMRALAGGEAVQLTHEPGDDLWPAWSPDSRFIAFASNRAGSFDIWVMPVVQGAKAVRLTSAAADETCPTWSYDGKKIAFHASDSGCTWIGIQNDLRIIAVERRSITDVKRLYRGARR